MLSFWPSFSLLVFFLVIFLECRVIGGRVTLPLGSFMMVFCYGAIGAPLLALLFQQILPFPDANADTSGSIAWLFGPPIEELAKALPVIVLAFLTRESRRLSIADLTLIGFASGAGFGFVEGNLNALVNGTLPSLQHLAAFGLQSQSGVIFFAGHPVSTALVGLAAGIGLRFLPPNFLYAWIPSAFVILWACFDHGIYNWKVLLAGDSGALPAAHFVVEFLHLLTLNGQLQTWLLPIGLVGAQFFEAYLCSKAVGARRDLLLAREWRPWVVNEWLVALLRAPLGRAAFGQTLVYFRLRRAFYLATFEARRDQKDPTLSRHARSLEDRLKRERSMLFDPPPGTWLLPVPVLKAYAVQWLWRMRWVLVFAVLLLFVFMLDPASLPEWLRQFLFGEAFTIAVVTAGLAFAVWRIVLFARLPPPDPLAAEGAACAGYYTRALLLGCALVCGLFPALTLVLGWKAFAPGAAFISGYLPAWIAQGGNLQTLLGLGTIGAAVAPDPRPAGEALRHEIAAGDERIRRLGSDIESEIGTGDTTAPGTPPPLKLDAFLETMAKLDAERDAQARRQLVLDEYARQAGESTVRDPAPVVQTVKDEFERLAGEVLDAAAKELDAIAALEQAYGRAWSEIMQDLDAHDALRRRLKTPLRLAWQAQNDIAWALRVVEATDECLLPMQLTLLPELHALATTANSERADMVAAGVERIRAAAGEYGEADPFAFAAGTNQTDEDEAALLAEFASAVPAEAPKPFGQRAPQPNAPEHVPDGEPIASDEPRGQHYQEALEQLIDAPRSDQGYLDTIRHLELSDETLEQPIEPQPDAAAILPTAAPVADSAGEVEDLIDAIKRDSGYLAFKDPQTAQADDDREAAATDESRDAGDAHAPANATAEAPDAADLQTQRVDEAAPVELEIAAAQDLHAPEHADDERASDDAPVSTSEQVADEAGNVAEIETPSVDEPDPSAFETVAAPTELRALEQADADEHALDDIPVSAIEQTADDAGDIADIQAPSVDEADPIELEIAVAQEDLSAVDSAEDAHEADTTQAEERAPVETATEEASEPTPASYAYEMRADVTATTSLVDEPAAPLEDIDSPVVASDDAETAAAARETESLRDVAEHTDTPAPEPAEEPGTRAERIEPVKAEEPSAREAFATPASGTLRAPEESPAKAEIRSSLFAKLFQSLRRQSADAAVKPAAGDRWQPKAEAPRTEPEREPLTTMPGIDDRRDAPAPDKTEAEPKTPPAEIDAPTAAWLADLATPNADEEIATVGGASLEAIEWPALSKPAEHHVPESALDVESLVGVADYVETPVDQRAGIETVELDIAPIAADETASVVVAQTVEPAADEVAVSEQTLDSTPAVEDQTLDVVTSDAAAPRDDAATVAEESAAPAPEAVDEFSSKADRLSYLLAKLETAMQAKAAAETATAADAEPAASSGPTEQTAPSDKPQEPVVVVQTPVTVVVAPSDERPVTIDAAQMEPKAAVEHKEAGDAPLKPDRLSYLLNKLFEAAKRETPAHTPQAHTIAAEAPPSQQSATDDASGEHILDLRVPDAGTAEQHASNSIEFGLSRAEPTEAPPATLREPEPEIVEPPAPAELPVIEIAPPEIELARLPDVESDDAELPEIQVPEPILPQPEAVSVESAPAPPSAPVQPVIRPRPAEPVARFGSRTRPPRPIATPARSVEAKTAAPVQTAEVRDPEVKSAALAPTAEMLDIAAKSVTPERAQEPVEGETPATMPRRDWKLGSPSPARGETPKAAESQSGDAGAAKKSETTFRVKTGSGALATVDAPIPGASASAEKMPGKYYGPRLAESDDETTANSPAQQRALSLADALTEYYAKAGQQQPPMHTTDRAALQRIIANGKLEAPRRRGAPWSTSGMSRRGDVAIRLKPGAEQFVEFVPSTEIFGQVPHYYPRGVGKGSYATHIPAGHLEYFDLATRQWAPVQRG